MWLLSQRTRPEAERSAIFGYAVLRANFDHNAPSFLDNFGGFVLDVLADRYPGSINESAIAQAIRQTFGLTIPDRVVGRLLRKLVKAKKVAAQDKGRYRIEESARGGLVSLRESMVKFESQQAELLIKFADFVKNITVKAPVSSRLIQARIFMPS